MKTKLATLILLAAISAGAQLLTVMTDTNGVVVKPSGFYAKNPPTNVTSSAAAGQATNYEDGVRIMDPFVLNFFLPTGRRFANGSGSTFYPTAIQHGGGFLTDNNEDLYYGQNPGDYTKKIADHLGNVWFANGTKFADTNGNVAALTVSNLNAPRSFTTSNVLSRDGFWTVMFDPNGALIVSNNFRHVSMLLLGKGETNGLVVQGISAAKDSGHIGQAIGINAGNGADVTGDNQAQDGGDVMISGGNGGSPDFGGTPGGRGGDIVLNPGGGGGQDTFGRDGQVNVSGKKIVQLADPEDSNDAATKNYVDNLSVNQIGTIQVRSGTVDCVDGLDTPVTFDSPLPDGHYIVTISGGNGLYGGKIQDGSNKATGFIAQYQGDGSSGDQVATWKAVWFGF